MLPEQQQRIMGYFIEEAKDHLNTIEQGLLNLQATLQDQEMLNEVFRAAHSVKGGAAMLGIGSIQKTAHRLEDYFKVLKEEERPIQIDQKLESLFLQVFDALQELLEQLQGPFGLTEDVANGIMSGVEPVFEQLHNHLEHLVHVGGGAPAQPAVAAVPQPAPTPAVDPVLVVFQGDVAARLRDLLQAFKSAESAQSRQQLQDICSELRQMGEPFNLASWCELLEIARQAIACSDNSYRTLAPIVIKEVKQAQDLILARRTSEVICSDRLRELVPVVVVPVTGVTGEADLGDLFDIPAVADNLAVDDLFAPAVELPTAAPEVRQPPVAEPVASAGLADYGFGDDLAEALDFEQPGPEVGMAELNSLADLFEGEVLDLGATWQEEEIVGPTMDSGPLDLGGSSDLDELTDTSDFSDLLHDFEEDSAAVPTATGLPKDDLASLFGDDDLLGGDQDAASPPSDFGSTASVTDEIDALFGDGFSDLDDEDTTPVVEANQSSLENLGELFADLEETELAAPAVVVQASLEEDLATGDGDSDLLALDGDSSLEGFDFDALAEEASPDLFDTATTLEDSNDLGDLDLDLFGDNGLPGDEIAAVDDTLDRDALDLFGDNGLSGDEIVAVDNTLDRDDILGDLFDAQTEPVVTVLEPLEIDDPWQEPSQSQGNTGNSLDAMFAASIPTDNSLDLADDLFGESEPASVETDPEVLDDRNALDFDLATLSVDSADGSEELLPDFNFDMEASLAAADNLSDSSEGLDFLLDAADLAEIQPSGASDASVVGADADEDALGDLWADSSADLPLVESTPGPQVAPTAMDDLTTDWLESENLAIDADTNDFSGSLDSLFDETSEGFGSFDLESDSQVDGLSELDAIALDTPSEAMSADTDDLFGLSLDAGLDELDGSADLSLDSLSDSSDLGLDLFEVADDGLAAIPADDPSLSGADLLPDLDLFGSDEPMDGATAESEELDLLGLAELEVPTGADLTEGAEPEANFDELDDLLADMPAGAPAQAAEPAIAMESAGAEDEFADLDALLGDAPDVAASNLNAMAPSSLAAPAEDDFADLEALLGDAPPPAAAPVPAPVATPAAPAPKVAADSEFDDLEKLLEDADKTMGGTPTVKGRGASAQPRRPKNPNVIDQTMRVPVKQLDNLSNLVGELVVNRNSLEQDQERLRQFLDNLLYQVQQLSDVGQRMRDLYERSLLESSLLASRQSYQSSSNAPAQSHSTGASFDALEMDRFTGFHSLSQEMIELIVRVRESASDIEFIIDETDQVTRNFRQVTTQLQEGLTRSRMVPFAQTADRLPRGVRDNAIKCGKQAELVVEGRETLIDKMILEQLYDPLNHLVNNAIAHGIETPEIRQAAGKPPSGRVTIRAFYQGNQTVISVSDDGAGIDPERIKAKAIEKKVITPAEAKTMNRLDVYDILFAPGFSGADQVTDLAGRGVGMDVVRTRLNEIRGTINIDSTIGKGTTFTIRLPLTLSISKALCCISNRARIAFPMDGVEDMLDVPKERIQTNAEGQSCIVWRDLLLPFQSLSDVLKYSRYLGRGSVYGGNQEDDIVSIVVLRSAGNFIALQVDQVLGEQEIVIKQLEGPVPKPVGVAGATVLGDGRIMPIADVLELIDLVQGRIPHQTGTKLWDQSHEQTPVEPPVAKTEPTVLIVDDSITVRELLSMTFNKVGYRVEQARDGQEAWEKLRSGLPCDMVFCDIEMPRMDGLELLSRIQKDTTLNHLPIAMLTSRGADRHRQMAVQLGARGYFTKPYLEEALLDAAQRMLKGEVLVTSGSPG